MSTRGDLPRSRMPSAAFSQEASREGQPVLLDGLDVVVHEVVPLLPEKLARASRGEPTLHSPRRRRG